MRTRERVAIAAAVGAVALIAADRWPVPTGGDLPAERAPMAWWMLLGLGVLFPIQVVVASRIRSVWAAGSNVTRAPWLAAAVMLTFLAMLLLNGGAAGRGMQMMAGACSLVPLVALVGGRCDAAAVAAALLLMGTVPGVLLFARPLDLPALFLTMTAAALFQEAMRYASRRGAARLAAGAGLAGGLSLLVSASALTALAAWAIALAGMVAFGVRRGDPLPNHRQVVRIVAGGVLGFTVAALALFGGSDVLSRLGESLVGSFGPSAEGDPHAGGRVGYAVRFALLSGLPLAVLAIARLGDEASEWRRGRGFVPAERGPHAPSPAAPLELPFAGALLLVLLLLDLLRVPALEVSRVWVLLLPMAVGAAAVSYGRRPFLAVIPVAAAQWLVLLALRAWGGGSG